MAIVYEHLRNDTNEVFYVGKGGKEERARIVLNKKQIRLGSFDTPGEAADAYQKAKLIYHV